MATSAPRYARAFAQVASANHLDSDAALGQMRAFADLVAGNRELREALTNPSVVAEQKLKVVDALAPRLGMMPQVRNFIAVVMKHERLGELNEIIEEYSTLADKEAGMVEAQIASARPLAPQDRAELEAQVSRMAGGPVRTTYIEDASLLGGAVIRIGSTVYDGSLKTQLADIKRRLVSAQIA
jgi:F-type H+-transporting ATPase subunit delta